MGLAVPVVIFVVLVSCCCNVVFLELMIKQDPGAGTTITFVQFLFVSLEGLMEAGRLKRAPEIPLQKYMRLVALFFVVSVISNYAFVLDVPMPLVLIIKSGSLMTNLVLGMTILKRRYQMSQYIGVFLITVGISIATLASASAKYIQSGEHTLAAMSLEGKAKGLTGVTLLVLSLVLASGMGIIQELMYKEHGKHIREAMFYTHALPLPGFLMFAPGIWRCLSSFSLSAPIALGPFALPSMWVYLMLNAVTQYVCIRSVFTLSANCPSLTVTLVVTLRKFLSLVMSIFYFQNPFTLYHWMGTGAVFLGTFLFSLSDLLPSRHKQD